MLGSEEKRNFSCESMYCPGKCQNYPHGEGLEGSSFNYSLGGLAIINISAPSVQRSYAKIGHVCVSVFMRV